MTLKQGVREAESFLHEILDGDNSHVAELLWAVILELTKEIMAVESLFPELQSAFERERAQYRARHDDAREAERLD